ncbi:MAG: hypothetical protein CL868_16760 [Cytophagaceae bacterium]|nr:hypothetical protein [Cytophagaceae bacterium]|tara:strand:+ start:1019 stop:2143 length:1125 start_codon:yes stop_codon:yes gene_type:complete
MKIKIVKLILLCCGIMPSLSAQQYKYTVEGKLSGIDVPMKAYLYYRDGDKKFADSTEAKNNKFLFKGELENPTTASLYVHYIYPNPTSSKDSIVSEGTRFILEDGKLTIEGDRIKTAQINGGPAQMDFAEYNVLTDSIGNAIFTIWQRQQQELPEDSTAAFQRLLYARQKILRDKTLDFMKMHPKSAFSFQLLQSNTVVVEDMDYVDSMLDILNPEFGQHERYMKIFEKVALAKKLSIGHDALDFSQTDDNGNVVSLSELNGKYVLIDFWASWCGPCRAEYPFLKKAYAKYKEKNFEIIGISLDDRKSNWINAIRSNEFEWIQLSDLKGNKNEVAIQYGVSAIPQNFLIDNQGKILAKNLRGEDLLDKLEEILK